MGAIRAGYQACTAGLIVLLAACAATPPAPIEQVWATHRERVGSLRHWQAEGKLALRSPEQSESASFQWDQQGAYSRVNLSGPMGVSATTLLSDGQTLEILQDGERSVWDITDPAAIERDTGWYLPLRALPHWLRGVPAPLDAVEELVLKDERLARLQQSGWSIHYEEYAGFGDYALPTRIRIDREQTRVRLIIRHWQPGPGS